MQTFLPYPSFAASAAALDDRRLGKQRVEALQVLRALTRTRYGWQRHPAVLMWRGHEEALAAYGLAVCDEWVRRGHADTCAGTIGVDLAAAGFGPPRTEAEIRAAGLLPPWFGDERLHRSHRSALVRKDPEHYRPLFPDADPEVPYHWPVRSADRPSVSPSVGEVAPVAGVGDQPVGERGRRATGQPGDRVADDVELAGGDRGVGRDPAVDDVRGRSVPGS